MKDLLTAIKSQLQTDLTYVRASDVNITEDERMLRDAMKSPAVGIKDGTIEYNIATQGADESSELFVKIIAYVDLQKPEAAIMGDSSIGKKGVLDILTDVKTSLRDNLLSGQADEVWFVSETESEFIGDEEAKIAIQMKILTVRYVRYGS